MLAPAAFPAFFLILTGFILFLLVTLSVPHIKTIYLLNVRDNVGTQIRLGVFGACYRIGRQVGSSAGITSVGGSGCSASSLGYSINYNPTTSGFGSRGALLVTRAISTALVLNPIACGFAGFSLIWAACAWLCSSRAMTIVALVSVVFAALASWVAFALNLALAIIARRRINRIGNFDASLGNAVWLALGGALTLSIAICAAACGAFGRYSNRRDQVVAPVNEKPKRRWPWQPRPYNGTY